MVEIKEEQGEIEISKSHLRHINYKIYTLLCMLLFSFITLKLIVDIFLIHLQILFHHWV